MTRSTSCSLIAAIVLALSIILPGQTLASGEVSAKSAILIEQESGRILYAKEAHEKRRIASITKIMTAILAIESGKMDKLVKVSSRAVGTEGSSIYLKHNEKIKLEDLVYGLMLRSGNDAAVAIAEYVGGSTDGFVYLMNQKAEQIGMANTEFANPHGLDDHENHYSTAYDMAILTRYAMQNKHFREIFGTKIHRAPNPGEKWDRVWKNKNKLLTSLYKYCTGGKTGYTKRAKRTLVTTASKDGLDLIAVTINAPSDWKDHTWMYESAFDQYDAVKILKEGTVKKISDPFYKGKIFLGRNLIYPLTDKEKDMVRVSVSLIKPKPEKWKEPADVPNIVGSMTVKIGDEKIARLPIYYENGKVENPATLWKSVKSLFFTMLGAELDG